MESYKNFLVVIDPTTEQQKALDRAIHLASLTGAKITAFLSIFDFSYEMTTMLSSEEREAMRQSVLTDRSQWIQDIIDNKSIDSENISVKVVWHNRPFEAIIKQVFEGEHDVLIKGTHQHDKLKSVIFTPTDWHLLRKCPIPVLLVKDHNWPENGNILGAVNVGTDEEEHGSLNQKIAEEANQLSSLIKANVHLVNSFPGTPVNIAIEIPEFDSLEYNSNMEKHHVEAMQSFAKENEVEASNTHVLEGLPEHVIKQVSTDIDAELVILGTIGRTGISAALIGNTAEHVIDQLDCDLLALKPEGYISPLAEES